MQSWSQALVRVESMLFIANAAVASVKSQVLYSSYPYK